MILKIVATNVKYNSEEKKCPVDEVSDVETIVGLKNAKTPNSIP